MADIGEQLDILIKIQQFDAQIYGIKNFMTTKPREIAVLKAAFQERMAILDAMDKELKEMQLNRKEKEMDLQKKEEEILKFQGQLYQVKTNKEYSALEREIAGHKADNSILEEEILLLMDEIEAQQKKITATKETLTAEEQAMKADEAKINAEIQSLQGTIKQLEADRAAMVPGVDKKVLAQYERILISRHGEALAPVLHESCGGCHTNLPPQAVNEVQLKARIVSCERCARILYWPQEQSE